ncbi:MAG: TRAP transporter small permease subunit [Cohaesibacteraceae bacterium]|nr:TRAP transporter small permease subunit [Cohaesibacteraceae bacterium]
MPKNRFLAIAFLEEDLTGLIHAASTKIASLERYILIVLAASVTLLILLNVVTRSLSVAIYWVDELAIYAMIWLVMIGGSSTIRSRQGISVTLLEGIVGVKAWKAMLMIVDAIILLFSITLVWLSWIWYDPLTLLSLGFDTAAFSGSTFNYIYDEPTLTIGMPKFLIWLIMPFTAITMTVHSISNLFTSLKTGLDN